MYPNLLAEMARLKITQKELAAVLNITENTIGAKIRGEKDFKFGEMVVIRGIFGKSLDYLFETDKDKRPA